MDNWGRVGPVAKRPTENCRLAFHPFEADDLIRRPAAFFVLAFGVVGHPAATGAFTFTGSRLSAMPVASRVSGQQVTPYLRKLPPLTTQRGCSPAAASLMLSTSKACPEPAEGWLTLLLGAAALGAGDSLPFHSVQPLAASNSLKARTRATKSASDWSSAWRKVNWSLLPWGQRK